MGAQPSTDHGRASRRRIIDAACELFYRRGVAATGLSVLATASGTGKGQLYHYFRDKPDLVLAVCQAQTDRTLNDQQPLLRQMSTAADLRAWIAGAIGAHNEGAPARCPLGALVSEVADQEPELRLALDAGFSRWRTELAAGLVRLQHRGDARTDKDADDLAEILLCAYEGGVLMSEVHGNTESLRLSLEHALDSILVEQPTQPAQVDAGRRAADPPNGDGGEPGVAALADGTAGS